MWKLLTGILSEALYKYIDGQNMFQVEQKGCRKGSRRMKDQLLIDKMVIKNCKKRLTGLGVAWINYKKAYDMIPHSWILKTMELVGVANNMKALIKDTMGQWNTELISGSRKLGNVKIKRGIFQGDSLSP